MIDVWRDMIFIFFEFATICRLSKRLIYYCDFLGLGLYRCTQLFQLFFPFRVTHNIIITVLNDIRR